MYQAIPSRSGYEIFIGSDLVDSHQIKNGAQNVFFFLGRALQKVVKKCFYIQCMPCTYQRCFQHKNS